MASFEIANEIGQAIFNNASIRRQNELDEIEESFRVQIEAAEGNVQRQEVLERQLEEERRRINQEQAQAAKRAAIFEILLNTASGIVEALPNVPLAIAVGAIGAVQLAIAESTPVPEFAEGTDNAPGGPVIVNDAGKRELIIPPSGKPFVYNTRKPVLTDQIPKGSTIIPDDIDDLSNDYVSVKANGDKKINDELIKIHHENETRIIERQIETIASKMDPNEIGKAVANSLPPLQYWEMSDAELKKFVKKGHSKSRDLNASRTARA